MLSVNFSKSIKVFFPVYFFFNTIYWHVHFAAMGDFPQKNIYTLTESVQCNLQSQVTHFNISV